MQKSKCELCGRESMFEYKLPFTPSEIILKIRFALFEYDISDVANEIKLNKKIFLDYLTSMESKKKGS
jgi:hypothetical protein